MNESPSLNVAPPQRTPVSGKGPIPNPGQMKVLMRTHLHVFVLLFCMFLLRLQLSSILVIEYSIEYFNDSSSIQLKHTVRSINLSTTCSRNFLSAVLLAKIFNFIVLSLVQTVKERRQLVPVGCNQANPGQNSLGCPLLCVCHGSQGALRAH